MQNPFRSEADAFRFVFLTVATFTATAVASLAGGMWPGLIVWLVLTLAAAGYLLRRRDASAVEKVAAAPHTGTDRPHVLVIAQPGAASAAVVARVAGATAGMSADVRVVCPAPVSRLDHWTSAVDGGRDVAQEHLDSLVRDLRAAGFDADGEVGDEDAICAIEDAVRTFGADVIVVASPTAEFVDSVGHDVVHGARDRFDVPIQHAVTGA